MVSRLASTGPKKIDSRRPGGPSHPSYDAPMPLIVEFQATTHEFSGQKEAQARVPGIATGRGRRCFF